MLMASSLSRFGRSVARLAFRGEDPSISSTRHWHSVARVEKTLTVRSERSRARGEVEEQAGREAGSLRLRCATRRPNGKGSTASEKVYESFVV